MLRSLAAFAAVPAAFAAAGRPATIAPELALRVLGEAKRAWRARTVPAYVVYSIDRETTLDMQYDMRGSYRDRVWYRTSDGLALTRRFEGARAVGALRLERPTFDAAKDPGPPTVDLFSLPLMSAAPAPVASDIPVIGHATAHAEYDYAVTSATLETAGADQRYHLVVRAAREPDRNRLQELWIDPSTYAIDRVKAKDRLFLIDDRERVVDVSPEAFDMRVAATDGVRHVTRIDTRCLRHDGVFDATVYRYTDVQFPATLPDWYFDDAQYRRNGKDAPTF
jgi:hypothetical protein